MNIGRSISEPETPPSPGLLRIFALIPVAINIDLAMSPACDHHLLLRVAAVVSGLSAGAILYKLSGRSGVAISSAFAIVGLSHFYVIAAAAVTDHFSEISIMGQMHAVASALWSCFLFSAVGTATLVREIARKTV